MQAALHDLIRASVDRAEADVEVLMPGFTHLQVRRICMPRPDCCHHSTQTTAASQLQRWYEVRLA